MNRAIFANRFLAFTITMILGMSFWVYADEIESLNSKIANAEKEETITLDKDYMEDIVIPSGKSVMLDLAGYTLRGTDSLSTATITVEKDAALTISGEGKIINNAIGNGAACIFNNGTVIINNGMIKKETGNKSYYNIANHGNMTINGGTILNDTPYVEGQSHASLVENGYYDYTNTNPVLGYVEGVNEANPSLEINGGTFDGGLNSIKNDDGATLVINDALVKNQIQVAVFNVNETTINGGIYEVPAGNDKTTIFNRKYDDVTDKGIILVTGGTFNADYFIEVINNATEAQMGEITITGGIFNTEKGLVNTEDRVDITTIKISGGTFAQEPSGDKLVEGIETFENENGEWIVGRKVTLTLKLENGSGDKIEEYLAGDEITLESLEREGYEFKGWRKDEETLYQAGDKIIIEEDLTLTAIWEEKIETSGENSSEVSGETSGENSNEASGETSGENNSEVSGEASGENSSEVSGEVSGESDKDKEGNSSSSHSSGNKTDENKEETNEKDEKENKPIVFDDVKEDDWFKEYIDKASSMKLIKGKTEKLFAPNENITRGMLIEILYRYSGAEEKTLTTFIDVSKDAYYAQAISWAEKNGIVKGVGDGKFEPDRDITREELATIMDRCATLALEGKKEESKIEVTYNDKEKISEFALSSIQWCTENKIMNGREDNKVAPKEKATRAEATTMIVRLKELLEK